MSNDNLALVEPYLDTLPPHLMSMVDDRFIDHAGGLLGAINTTRAKLINPPYASDDSLLVVHQMAHVAHRHEHHAPPHRRNNGEPYYTHEAKAAQLLAEMMAVTGLPSILTLLMHDDIEDLDMKADELIDINYYKNKVEIYSEDDLRRIQKIVGRNIDALTKVKKVTQGHERSKKEIKAATFKKLLEGMLYWSMRVLLFKLADRLHNMATLDGHVDKKTGKIDKDKQLDIARETLGVYVPLAHITRVFAVEAQLLQDCAKYLNVDLHTFYGGLMKEKRAEFLDPHRAKIEDQFKSGDDATFYPSVINSLDFVPHALGERLRRSGMTKNLATYEPDDLKVDPQDPLFDIFITVQSETQIDDVVAHIFKRFSGGTGAVNIQRLHHGRGTLVSLYNRSFGGRLYFRINEQRADTHAKRGLLSRLDQLKLPVGVRKAVDMALQDARQGRDIFDAANEHLLNRRIITYTPHGEAIELTRGATVLDFALRVHPDFLIGAQDAFVSDDLLGNGRHAVSLFDELAPGNVVEVNSCLAKKSPDLSKIKVKPWWKLFCQDGAGQKISSHLASSPEKAVTLGEAYIEDFCKIFGYEKANILNLLKGQVKESEDEKIYKTVGTAEYDLLKVMDGLAFATDWDLQVDLPDVSGSFATFASEFQKIGINMDNSKTWSQSAKLGYKSLKLAISFDAQKVSLYDFMREMIRLYHKGYDMRVFSSNAQVAN